MTRQLALISITNDDWRLDQVTIERGKRGVTEARAVLLQRRRPAPVTGAPAR